MENREAFTGISAEPEESVDEVNWRQNYYNQRGRGYSNRGSNRGSYRGNCYPPSSAVRGRGHNTYGNNNSGSNGYTKKAGTLSNPDVRCLICGLKGHKVTTCRQLPRAQKLIRQDKQQYWKNKKDRKGNTSNRYKKQQINEVDEAEAIDKVDQYQDEDYDGTEYEGLEELSFPFSEYSKEKDQAYYDDNWLDLEYINEVTLQQHHHMHFIRQEEMDIVL